MQRNPFTKEYTEHLLRKEVRRLYAKKGRAEKMLAFRRLGYSYREIAGQFYSNGTCSREMVQQTLNWYIKTYKVKKADLKVKLPAPNPRIAEMKKLRATGKTYAEIGRIFKVSGQYVSQVINKL